MGVNIPEEGWATDEQRPWVAQKAMWEKVVVAVATAGGVAQSVQMLSGAIRFVVEKL